MGDDVEVLHGGIAIAHTIARSGELVRCRVDADDANFTEMCKSMGAQARFGRRRRWFEQHAARFRDALA